MTLSSTTEDGHGKTGATGERFVGASVNRVEDPRLLTGRARFVDDITLPGMLHAAFVRSTVPHARLIGVDVSAARSAPGVAAVLTAPDLAAANVQPVSYDAVPEFLLPRQYPALAHEKVRYIGDPIAVVVATSRAAAEDAAELVVVDDELLPATGTIEQALSGERPPVWDETGSNVIWQQHREFGDPASAFGRAHRVVPARLRQHRVTNAPMETRGLIASFDPGRRELVCYAATQAPQHTRLTLARMLGLPAHSVRVVNGDIGGSFGQKAWVRHEDVTVAAASVILGRPVKWIEDRSENLATAGQARDEYADLEVAVDADGSILGVRLALFMDQGAYPIAMNLRSTTAQIIRTLFPSAYRIEHFDFSATVVATNKGSYTTYRGPWAAETWLRERMFTLVARELGMDPVEFRRRNLWLDDDLPREMATGPTMAKLTIRSSLDRLEAHPIYAGFRDRQQAARTQGRLLGIGVSTFLEPAPGPPNFLASVSGITGGAEPARARIEPDGTVTVTVIQAPGGQGHETTFAQIAADELGVDLSSVRVVHGDTAVIEPSLFGTAGSRSAYSSGGAVQGATRTLGAKLRGIAAHLLEASPDDIDLADGRAFVRGTPEHQVPHQQLAMVGWYAAAMLPEGMTTGLEVVHQQRNTDAGFSQAVHCCVVEVDEHTGLVKVVDYVVFEDCGDVINGAIVDGQVRGGVAQGIATVLYERVVYDDDANFFTSTLVDYLIPTAAEIPPIEVHHVEGGHRSEVNFRGVGEGGAICSPAAVSNAIEDALSPFRARVTELYMPPPVVLGLIQAASQSIDVTGSPASRHA
jgi:carbon-monoxide dehydrogenase large subunit